MLFRAFFLITFVLWPQSTVAQKVNWTNIKCCGTDIAVGADHSVWLVGADKRLHRYEDGKWVPDRKSAGVVRVAVAPDGTPWVTNTKNEIWNRAGGKWTRLNGRATDIAVGADGTAWVTGMDGAAYRRDGNKWQRIGGKAARIAVDPQGNAWVVNGAGKIYRWDGRKFTALPGGNGADIGIGADGSVWLTLKSGDVYRWDGKTWIKHNGKLVAIAAGPKGGPWGVASNRKIYAAAASAAAAESVARGQKSRDGLVALRTHFPQAVAAIENADLRDEGTHLEGQHEVFGQTAGIVVYTPKGKRLANIALTFNKVDIDAVLRGLDKPSLIPAALQDLTLFLVPPGNGQDGVWARDLPKVLQKPVEAVFKVAGSNLAPRFDLEPGLNFLSRADASKRPDVNSVFALIGLDKLDDLTITGRLQRLAIKKHGDWKEPFGQKDLTIRKATILIVTTKVSDFFGTVSGAVLDRTAVGKPHYRNISIWGNTRVKGRDYLVFGQQAYLKSTPKAKPKLLGTAYGFDTDEMTLGDMINLAKLLPWTRVMPLPGTGKIPLDVVGFTNPKHRPYNAVSYGVPPFTDMMLVSASKGVMIPDGKPLPGSKGIPNSKAISKGLRGSPGPLMYVNGGVKLAGRTLGNGDIHLSARGLFGSVEGAAGMNLGKMLGKSVKLESGGRFGMEITSSKQLIELASTMHVAGFAKRDALITFKPSGAWFTFDMGCAPPIKVDTFFHTPAKPWESIDDMLLGVSVNHGAVYDCGGKALKFIGDTMKEVGKEIAGAAKVTAKVAENVSKAVASQISGGFKSVGGKVVGLFKKKKKKRYQTSKDCDYNSQIWLYSYGTCWTTGHKYLYFATNRSGDGFCLQVNAAKNQNKSKLEFGKCDMNWTQQWRFDNGKIVNARGRCIDADGGTNATSGARIQLYDCHGRANQQWKLTPKGRIQGINGLCIGADQIKDDADLKLGFCGSSTRLPGWMAISAGNFGDAQAHYVWRHRASGKCLDKSKGTRQGVALKIWDCGHSNNNQKFRGGRQFISAHSGNCYVDEGRNGVRGWNCTTSRSNRMIWRKTVTPHGSITISNRVSKKCLQVRGGATKNGAAVEGGNCLGNFNQQWFLEPAR